MKKSISEQPTIVYVRECHTVMPNQDDSQEIRVLATRFVNGEEVELVFTPEDWLDTFTPTMYERVKESYIKYIRNKR